MQLNLGAQPHDVIVDLKLPTSFFYGFADDHQIFKSFNMGQQFNVLACKLPQLFNQITNWMTSHFLLLNPGKTEIIVSSEIIYGTFLSSSICIRFVSTVKNLGFHLDSNLNFKKQISSLKSSCYHKLRNISKMQPHLSSKQLEILTISLVTSSLDYCNSLYYGINSLLLNQLQSIQNSMSGHPWPQSKRTHFNPHEEPTLA